MGTISNHPAAKRQAANERALQILAEALREKFPGDTMLADQDLVDKHGLQQQLQVLSQYYEALQVSHDLLDQQLLNAG